MILELNNVSKDYPIRHSEPFRALKKVNLRVEQGDFISIQGVSGSGKSTLLNILGLIDDPTEGQYLVDGVDTAGLGDGAKSKIRGEHISFVLQDFALINSETAYFNASLPLYLLGVKKREIKRRVEEVFAGLDIADQINKRIREMSGGQRQRVAIARAMVTRPKIILADEPTGALDQKTSNEVMRLLIEMSKENRMSLVLVTHEPSLAALADKQWWMLDGVLHQEGRAPR